MNSLFMINKSGWVYIRFACILRKNPRHFDAVTPTLWWALFRNS